MLVTAKEHVITTQSLSLTITQHRSIFQSARRGTILLCNYNQL